MINDRMANEMITSHMAILFAIFSWKMNLYRVITPGARRQN